MVDARLLPCDLFGAKGERGIQERPPPPRSDHVVQDGGGASYFNRRGEAAFLGRDCCVPRAKLVAGDTKLKTLELAQSSMTKPRCSMVGGLLCVPLSRRGGRAMCLLLSIKGWSKG